MFLSIAIALAHTALLHCLFGWAMRRWPEEPRLDVSHLSEDEIRRRAVFANRLGTALYLFAWPVLTVATFLAFMGLHQLLGPRGRPLFLIRSEPILYLAAAVPAGFILCGPAGLLLLRLCLWRNYHAYMACGDRHFRLDIRRYMYWASVWVIPFMIDAVFHYGSAYTAFWPDRITRQSWWELSPRRYAWTDVRGIFRITTWDPAEVAKIGREPKYVIEFNDGRCWTSADHINRESEQDDQIIALAEAKSGQPVREVKTSSAIGQHDWTSAEENQRRRGGSETGPSF